MSAVLFWGCVLVAFSVPLGIFLTLVVKRPQLLVISIASAFFWQLGIVVSSIFWIAIPPLQEVNGFVLPMTDILLEAARFSFIYVYMKTEESFALISTNSIMFPLSDITSSIAAGVGFSGMQTVIMFGGVVGAAQGPGTLFSPYCPNLPVYITSGLNAFFIGIIHILLMILAFDSFRQKSFLRAARIVVIHLASSLFTLLNSTNGGCYYTIPIEAFIMLSTALLTHRTVNQRTYRSKRLI